MTLIEEIIETAYRFIGFKTIKYNKDNPFNKGNNLDTGFDCSGIWQFILLQKGISLYNETLRRNIRYAREFFDFLGEYVSYGEHRKGDLVFFSYCGTMPTHMGLYVGNNRLIHKGFCDTSLVPVRQLGSYPKCVVLSDLDRIAEDKRNAGRQIKYRRHRGEQKYFTNPIG